MRINNPLPYDKISLFDISNLIGIYVSNLALYDRVIKEEFIAFDQVRSSIAANKATAIYSTSATLYRLALWKKTRFKPISILKEYARERQPTCYSCQFSCRL